MKCDMCENDATVFLTQIVDGKMTQVNLCDKCSKEKGVTDPTGFQLAGFLFDTAAQKKAKSVSPEDDTLACPECGFTRAHLKKIGRMGCPECYRTFADDLDGMLKAMHKGTRHVGKAPGKPSPAVSTATARRQEPSSEAPTAPLPKPVVVNPKKRLAELKVAIEKAVAEERYEDAAKMRDEMRALEG
jgi:protein arginine kinase activator